MQFDYSSSKNVPRHKRFQRLNSNKKIGWNGIENVQSHIVLNPNGNIHFGGEYVVFQLTHTSWMWRGSVWIDT
jgi:hypothetical protein